MLTHSAVARSTSGEMSRSQKKGNDKSEQETEQRSQAGTLRSKANAAALRQGMTWTAEQCFFKTLLSVCLFFFFCLFFFLGWFFGLVVVFLVFLVFCWLAGFFFFFLFISGGLQCTRLSTGLAAFLFNERSLSATALSAAPLPTLSAKAAAVRL